MSFNYYTDIPNGPNNPSDDQPLMKINTNSINSLIAVDHFSFGEGNDGKHDIIHYPVPQGVGTSPGTGSVEWAQYTKTLPSSSVEAFWQRPASAPNSADIQMTANVVPVIARRGVTFIPGGIILQWALEAAGPLAANTNTTFSVSFSPAFITDCYNVSITIASFGGGIGTATSKVSARNSSGFNCTISTGSGLNNINGFYWTAIGS